MQKLIILRGCMGSGKSTIAKQYCSFRNKTAWINIDSFKNLFDHFEKEARPFTHGAANASLEYLLKEKFSVVMEGVFQNPAFIQQAVDIAKAQHVPCRVFELQASLEVLQKRDRNRIDRGPLGEEAIKYMSEKIQKQSYKNSIVINTDEITIDETICFIDKKFQSR